MRKLGRNAEPEAIFRALVESARRILDHAHRSTPSPRSRSNSRSASACAAHYALGLAAAGLGQLEDAKSELIQCLKISPDHLAQSQARPDRGGGMGLASAVRALALPGI